MYDVSLGLSRLKRLLQIALGFIWRAVTVDPPPRQQPTARASHCPLSEAAASRHTCAALSALSHSSSEHAWHIVKLRVSPHAWNTHGQVKSFAASLHHGDHREELVRQGAFPTHRARVALCNACDDGVVDFRGHARLVLLDGGAPSPSWRACPSSGPSSGPSGQSTRHATGWGATRATQHVKA